jgi:hypothetical protein
VRGDAVQEHEELAVQPFAWSFEVNSVVEGEGSGTAMNWIIEPALTESTGELTASCIWEGGDSINQLILKNGVVSWRDIEI